MSRYAPVLLIGLLTSLAISASPAISATPTMLVANVDLVELASVDDRHDQRENAARATMLSEHIRAAVAKSDRYRVLDHGLDGRADSDEGLDSPC